jgi:membrane dipeptidase
MASTQSKALQDLTPADRERADELHRSSIVIDCCGSIRREREQFDVLAAGGVTALSQTVPYPMADLPTALQEINTFRRWLDEHPDRAVLARDTADIRAAKADGKAALILGPQHSEFLDRDVSRVGTFHDLGVRIMQLTYQTSNWIGDGCGEANPGGLSRFGQKVVEAMEETGIVIDLSHTSHPTSMDAIEAASGPVICSHANVHALTPHARTKRDDLIKALADKGGVVGLTALSVQNEAAPGQRPNLDQYLAHVQHLLDLVGPDHIGIGLDFHEHRTPEMHAAAHRANPELGSSYTFEERRIVDLTTFEEVPNITRGLVALGLSDDTIRKILGGNFLRVFEQVWGS